MKDPTSMGEVFLADPPSRGRQDVSAPPTARGWAVSGVVAGVLGLVTIVVSMGLWDPDLDYSDPVAIAGRLKEAQAQLIVMHVATVAGMVALVVFALGLARRLNAVLPGSLLGGVAAAGIGLTAVANLMGSGLDTEFLFAADVVEKDVPETIAFYNHWIATIPWLWVGAGLTGVVLAIAALKHKVAPRWIGIVGATLGALTLVMGISPLQYMAGFVGPVWLLVTALGFTLGDRPFRTAAARRAAA